MTPARIGDVTMEQQQEWLAQRFEEHRPHLRAVAYRMLGSVSEADDAVQDAWIRLSRSDTSEVQNLGAWLTTVVARRLAFVLHDMFAVPFEEIATILDRSPDAARQLASRGRRRIRGSAPVPDADLSAQWEVVEAFLAAARDGNFAGLVAVLDPDVVLRADGGLEGISSYVEGAETVASQAIMWSRTDLTVHRALINGAAGVVSMRDGEPFSVVAVTVRVDRIVEMDILSDPERVRRLDLAVLGQ
jgi:RNA polymerase sigma-70 factor, ECF subfamily